MIIGKKYPKIADTLGGATPEIKANKKRWLLASCSKAGTKRATWITQVRMGEKGKLRTFHVQRSDWQEQRWQKGAQC